VNVGFDDSAKEILEDECADEAMSLNVDVPLSEEVISVLGMLSVDNPSDDKSVENT
jgi:hypothetical protein